MYFTRSRFNLCGRIIIDKLPEGLSYTSPQREVTLNPKGQPKEVTILTSDNHGAFCAEVKPGTYVLKVRNFVHMVPTWTGKMRKLLPIKGKSGEFVRDWKSQGI